MLFKGFLNLKSHASGAWSVRSENSTIQIFMEVLKSSDDSQKFLLFNAITSLDFGKFFAVIRYYLLYTIFLKL